MIIMQKMSDEIKFLPLATTEEEAMASLATAIRLYSKELEMELCQGIFNKAKAESLMNLYKVVQNEYNFLALKKDTLH